ncbi:MAG: hypothetical protein FJZ43_02350 [Candidatus Staskawiczbacteria bacterium]|nr:hypothetical protein [Candidatus Staskawiczbacteria bacterium]
MSLDNIANVKMNIQNAYKFIVAEVSEGSDKKIIVRVGTNMMERHYEIDDALTEELTESNTPVLYKVLGGGFVQSNWWKKEIILFGESKDYGQEPDRSKTVKLIQNEFTNYEIKAEV